MYFLDKGGKENPYRSCLPAYNLPSEPLAHAVIVFLGQSTGFRQLRLAPALGKVAIRRCAAEHGSNLLLLIAGKTATDLGDLEGEIGMGLGIVQKVGDIGRYDR